MAWENAFAHGTCTVIVRDRTYSPLFTGILGIGQSATLSDPIFGVQLTVSVDPTGSVQLISASDFRSAQSYTVAVIPSYDVSTAELQAVLLTASGSTQQGHCAAQDVSGAPSVTLTAFHPVAPDPVILSGLTGTHAAICMTAGATVGALSLIGTLPAGTVGVPYSGALTAIGGLPPYSGWNISSGTLPAGLSINSSTGLISGIPTTAASSSFTVQVFDSLGSSATSPQTVVISMPSIQGTWLLANVIDTGTVWEHSDPSTWPTSAALSSPATLLTYGGAYDGSALVLAATSTDVLRIPNQMQGSTLTSSVINAGVSGERVYAVGGIFFFSHQAMPGAYAYSTDHGVTWSTLSVGGLGLRGIARLNSGRWLGLFISGSTQQVMYSDQGFPTTWIAGFSGFAATVCYDIACDGTTAIIVNNSQQVYRSTDGVTFTSATSYPEAISSPSGLILRYVGNSIWLGSDNSDSGVCRSADNGATWSHISMPVVDSSAMTSMGVHNGTIACGFAGTSTHLFVSNDYGVTWSTATLPWSPSSTRIPIASFLGSI